MKKIHYIYLIYIVTPTSLILSPTPALAAYKGHSARLLQKIVHGLLLSLSSNKHDSLLAPAQRWHCLSCFFVMEYSINNCFL